jgi:proline racemase
MMEKMEYVRNNMDEFRQWLMYEPRGHSVMSGCILTEPVSEDADIGVIFIEVGGYLPMCGHDTIGLVTALVETGQVPHPEHGTVRLTLDTPSGVVPTVAHVEEGRCVSVSFTGVPSFLYAQDVVVTVPNVGTVTLDVAWGGNFYGLVPADRLGVDLRPEGGPKAIALARAIRQAVNRQHEVVHPLFPNVRGLTHVEYFGPADIPGADGKNMVIVPPGGVDRSPCGTGTCAKAAVLYARKELAVGGSFVHESVTGATFRATILGTEDLAGYEAVRVRITGSAHVYGESTLVREAGDPLPQGFFFP